MAAPLSSCTVEEQRSVFHFFCSQGGVKPSEIYRRMKVQYGDSCLSQGRGYEWVERFQKYFKHAAHPPFFSSKCRLFRNATFFGSCVIHILHTVCAKI
jgi:hypothetical protein